MEEVARTTGYTGHKREDDANAYERISTTDADKEALERFWSQGVGAIAEAFKSRLATAPAVAKVSGEDTLTIKLELPSNFDTRLTQSMQSELWNYLAIYIAGQWFKYSNRPDTQDYINSASAILEGVRRMAFTKIRPTRPTYS